MPIDKTILSRLLQNDPNLNKLNLSYKKLNDSDINELILALKNNTFLTSLNISHNEITDEAVKKIATNKSLISLNLSWNNLGDDSAIALAQNQTIINLNLEHNNLGNKGARALASNQILISLNIHSNKIEKYWEKKLIKTIKVNHYHMILRRNHFIQVLITLIRDRVNSNSQSLLSILPPEIFLKILYLISTDQLIGKSLKQTSEYIKFIFDNIDVLDQRLKNKDSIKVLEKKVGELSQFSFFSSQASGVSNTIFEEDRERHNALKLYWPNLSVCKIM